MQAKTSARPKLKSGPAKATTIFCQGEAGGSSSRGRLALALDGFHRRHLRQRDVAAGGDRAEHVLDAVDFFRPERLAEPDGEFVDLQPAPFRGEEMAELMDDDQDVKEEDDFEKGDERKERAPRSRA